VCLLLFLISKVVSEKIPRQPKKGGDAIMANEESACRSEVEAEACLRKRGLRPVPIQNRCVVEVCSDGVELSVEESVYGCANCRRAVYVKRTGRQYVRRRLHV
jgi:hypothetical protein